MGRLLDQELRNQKIEFCLNILEIRTNMIEQYKRCSVSYYKINTYISLYKISIVWNKHKGKELNRKPYRSYTIEFSVST
jgi:hypothetical protein